MRYAKLRGCIKEQGLSEAEIANQMGLSKSAMSMRLNEKVPFTVDEVIQLCDILNITDSEVGAYFFNKVV